MYWDHWGAHTVTQGRMNGETGRGLEEWVMGRSLTRHSRWENVMQPQKTAESMVAALLKHVCVWKSLWWGSQQKRQQEGELWLFFEVPWIRCKDFDLIFQGMGSGKKVLSKRLCYCSDSSASVAACLSDPAQVGAHWGHQSHILYDHVLNTEF